MKYNLSDWKNLVKSRKIILGICISGLCIFMLIPQKVKSVNLPRVITKQVAKKDIPYVIKIPSTLSARSDIKLRTRIDGQIKSVHFKEGAYVEKGDLLFTIDDDLLQAQLKQAEANLEKNKALFEQAQKEVDRNRSLLKKNIVTQSAFDQLEATLSTYKANMASDKANIESFRLQISYTRITSPIKGIIGFIKVEPGSFVRQAEDVELVSIAEINPMEVIFAVPEKYLKDLLMVGVDALKIRLFNTDNTELKKIITPVAINEGIDIQSGTFLLKGSIQNEDFSLRSGLSVTGEITLGQHKNSLVIPIDALLMGQNGNYTYVYDQNTNIVKRTPITPLQIQEDEVIIQSGLAQGQHVVTQGQIHITDGMKVTA